MGTLTLSAWYDWDLQSQPLCSTMVFVIAYSPADIGKASVGGFL
jgi:hypothetical protein